MLHKEEKKTSISDNLETSKLCEFWISFNWLFCVLIMDHNFLLIRIYDWIIIGCSKQFEFHFFLIRFCQYSLKNVKSLWDFWPLCEWVRLDFRSKANTNSFTKAIFLWGYTCFGGFSVSVIENSFLLQHLLIIGILL